MTAILLAAFLTNCLPASDNLDELLRQVEAGGVMCSTVQRDANHRAYQERWERVRVRRLVPVRPDDRQPEVGVPVELEPATG